MALRRNLLVGSLVLLLMLVLGFWLTTHLPDEASWPILLFFMILEVVIAPIPGGAITFVAVQEVGYWAWPLSYAGNIIGAALVFWLVHRFGRPYIKRVARDGDLKRYDRLITGHRGLLALAYAVPVVPIDVLTLAAGASRMPWRRFMGIAAPSLIVYSGLQTLFIVQLAEFLTIMMAISLAALAVVVLGLVYVGYELFS